MVEIQKISMKEKELYFKTAKIFFKQIIIVNIY